jgi:[1-hydroxy-2-(trimethylamino)ethyl]phosphonate dioxygenase
VLVVAALLHDIGHLIHGLGEDIAYSGSDAKHEEAGQQWLARYFGPDVTEPVRLHVDAKRYLCGCESRYEASLSPASRQSLALQGGPMNDAQRREFAEQPFARDAVRLRRWDDRAKTPGLEVPELGNYVTRLRSAARHAGSDHAS